ncbi:PepSY domain-containing protein [Pseudomonas guineae]|uniref:PepSY domain-containing protein n=1 Tax=Pseudomonas guineae TaxID=425504 RepID=UPI0030EF0265|tara:strand:- start:6751 stop:7068 length:318 start_codon:yes stop_codon:yes gene_type:complete
MTTTAWLTRALLAVLLLTLALSSSARDLDQDEALRLRREGLIMPLEQLLQIALLRHPGAVLLDVELEEEDGVLVYEVELLTEQNIVRELELHAITAEVLKDEVED